MNASELAVKMLEWEEIQREANKRATEIEAAVLKLGRTQTVGNCRATYSQGARKFDYETPGQIVDADVIAEHTTTVIKTDWRAVCKAIAGVPVVVTQAAPSVKVKLL